MISVMCECGKRLKAEDRHAGRRTKCPNCGAWNTLIEGVAEAPGSQRHRFASLAPAALAQNQPVPYLMKHIAQLPEYSRGGDGVRIYGTVDMGAMYSTTDNASGRWQLHSGVSGWHMWKRAFGRATAGCPKKGTGF